MDSTSEIQRAVTLLESAVSIVRQQLASPSNDREACAGITPGSTTPRTTTVTTHPNSSIDRFAGAGHSNSIDSLTHSPRGTTQHSLSTGTTQNLTTRSSNVLSEWRRAFAPYDQASTSRGGRRQPLTTRRSTGSSRTRFWNHRIMCLGGPTDTSSPNPLRKAQLQELGLELRAVHIDCTANADQFKNSMIELFPPLTGYYFEVLRAVGGGAGKPLVRISPTLMIPDVAEIETVIGSSILYIRPTVNLCQDQPDATTSERSISAGEDSVSMTNSDEMPNAEPAQVHSYGIGEIVTLKDWREQLYSTFTTGDTTTIFVQRDDFASAILGVYKSPRINMYKPPEIIFAGEAGADSGALTKEYFWNGITALTTGKFNGRLPYFEGECDAKLPSADGALLRSGTYTLIGKFFRHCAVHMGIAFTGLSDCVGEYLTTETVDTETPFTIAITDIPDAEVRDAVCCVDKWKHGESPAQAELELVEKVAIESGFFEKIDETRISLLREHLLYYHVIEKRKCQLDAIKKGFWDEKLLPFVKDKEYVRRGLFPKWKDLNAPAQLVTQKLKCDQQNPIVEYVKEYIIRNSSEAENTRKLLLAWTGWPEIPEEELKIVIGDADDQFMVRTCFQELVVPISYQRDDVFKALDLLLEHNMGFGLV